MARVLSGQERPSMKELLSRVAAACRSRRVAPPSRATLYKLLSALAGPEYVVQDLPRSVQAALYNLEPRSRVPGRQVVFYCFNYGDLEAVSFAAGLPWLAVYQALRTPGYHEQSRGLVEAVAMARGIIDGRA